jgi:hypothetical protein
MLAGLSVFSRGACPQRFDFRYSQGAFRDNEIFDSALSVPGRFVAEVGRRLLVQTPAADEFVVANPLLPLTAAQLHDWTAAADGPAIGTDQAGFPLFYRLPRRLWESLERFLLLLSFQDSALDARLLTGILGTEVAIQTAAQVALGGIPPRGANGWLNGDGRLAALKLQCARAVAIVERGPGWRDVPFVSYYPMHAGDVLFMGIASRLANRSHFAGQVVCQAYADIPAACESRLRTMKLRLPWISRDGSVSEATYFAHALDRLGEDVVASNFFVFSRILRLYFATPFHLVDHARFALGDSLDGFAHTIHALPNAERRCAKAPDPLRVLFHLNGGWKLKTYPVESMRTVIRALRAAGVEVSVLGRPDLIEAGAVSYDSEDSATLRGLVESHHVFVGVDSFPHHFARLVVGWPTIGLFGNTKPCNSDARYGDAYRSSDLAMACNRCGAYDVCPALGRDDCVNYAPPERVIGDVFTMAKQLYGRGEWAS